MNTTMDNGTVHRPTGRRISSRARRLLGAVALSVACVGFGFGTPAAVSAADYSPTYLRCDANQMTISLPFADPGLYTYYSIRVDGGPWVNTYWFYSDRFGHKEHVPGQGWTYHSGIVSATFGGPRTVEAWEYRYYQDRSAAWVYLGKCKTWF